MSNCSSSRNDLDFFSPLSQSALETKDPPHPTHSLICLGGAPLGGGSAWTERALPEDYRMTGGEMCDCDRVYICVGGVYICVGWVWGTLCEDFWVGLGYMGWGDCMQFFSPKMLQLSPRLNSTALTLIFQSIHYLLSTYLCLQRKKKHSGVKKGLFTQRRFLTALRHGWVKLNCCYFTKAAWWTN